MFPTQITARRAGSIPIWQSIRVALPQGGAQRKKVCTTCIKAGKIAKAA